MATGTPKQPRARSGLQRPGQVELTYPGKKDADEILRSTACELTQTREGSLAKRIYFAENRAALATLVKDPTVCGHVNLVYIDPPYATQTVFHSRALVHAYEDVYEQAEYLEFMRERLILLHRLLAETGSIYVHIDEKMLFHVKLLLDEIFGSKNFRNCITRRKSNPKNFTRKTFGNISDYILFYTKSDKYAWNRQFEAWTTERAKEYAYVDETGRRFMKVPVHAPGTRNGETGKPWRNVLPPKGKHWQFPPSVLDELDEKGEIFWSKNGNPRRKVFLDQSPGINVQDIWTEFRDAHNQMAQITGYPTEKNADMLARIISASSDPGDLVLDCFAGSGTTMAVADKLGRKWIGIDNSAEAIRTMLHRFEHGAEKMGDFVQKPRLNEEADLFGKLTAPMTTKPTFQRVEDFSVFEQAPLATIKVLPADDQDDVEDRPKRRKASR